MHDRQRSQAPRTPHVLVVGGGFGGLYAARTLARFPLRVTLLDRSNHHLFQPLLYQVATAALAPGDIAAPIRFLLRKHSNVRVLLGEAAKVNPADRQVLLADGERLDYDFLVLATGARHSYFGKDEWEPIAPGLKSIDDALEIRGRILLAFEAAERATDPALQRALLTFVVVGGGPTGVELAGAIAEIARHTLVRDFRSIDPSTARVILIEAGPRVLAPFAPDISAKAERSLRRLGVEVRTGAMVTEVTPDCVKAGDEVIPSHTTLWAAGVAALPLARTLGVETDRSGRIAVEPDLSVPGLPEVFAVGDTVVFSHQAGKPLPGLAPVAMQQGRVAAENIWRRAQGLPTRAFRYRDRGTMATIGRATGVAQVGPLHLSGFAGWLAWLVVHLYYLIGFENRLLVLIQWAWSYFTFKRGSRLITGERVVRRAPPRD